MSGVPPTAKRSRINMWHGSLGTQQQRAREQACVSACVRACACVLACASVCVCAVRVRARVRVHVCCVCHSLCLRVCLCACVCVYVCSGVCVRVWVGLVRACLRLRACTRSCVVASAVRLQKRASLCASRACVCVARYACVGVLCVPESLNLHGACLQWSKRSGMHTKLLYRIFCVASQSKTSASVPRSLWHLPSKTLFLNLAQRTRPY